MNSFQFDIKSEWIEPNKFLEFIQHGGSWLDVRAPVEFQSGHVPNSVNLGILSNEERAEVGTTFRQKGQLAAVALGNALVSGQIKDSRVEAWISTLSENSKMAITCARGGMRSALTQAWLKDRGLSRPRARGGIKALRGFYIESFQRLIQLRFCTVGGPTGAGKTILLNELRSFEEAAQQMPSTIDLEAMARHRGSAFGSYPDTQPAQATFENRVAHRLIELEAANLQGDQLSTNEVRAGHSTPRRDSQIKPWFLESESRMIGRLVLPNELLKTIIHAPLILVRESIEARIENTFDEYIRQTALSGEDIASAHLVFETYRNSLKRITNKLGTQRMTEILKIMDNCEVEFQTSRKTDGNREWIQLLLQQYYDPMYEYGLKNREGKIIFEGRRSEALSFMKSLTATSLDM